MGCYFVSWNWNGCWTSCFTFLPPTSAARYFAFWSDVLTACVNRSWLD